MAKIKNLLTVILCAFSLLLFTHSPPVFAQTVVGSLDTIYGKAKSINNQGYVLILDNDYSGMMPKYHAGIWKNDDISPYHPIDLTSDMDMFETTNNLNDNLKFVGTTRDNNIVHGFIYDVATDSIATIEAVLNVPNIEETHAFAINNNDVVVGTYKTVGENGTHLYLLKGSVVTIVNDDKIGCTVGADYSCRIVPQDINNNGVVVGYLEQFQRLDDPMMGVSYVPIGRKAFVLNPSSIDPFSFENSAVEISNANYNNIIPSSLNDTGMIVGTAVTTSNLSRGFITSISEPTIITEIASMGTYDNGMGFIDFTNATSVNASGQIVGTTSMATGDHAFLREADGTMVDLGIISTIDDPGSYASEALSINDSGYIVGSNCSTDASYQPYYPVIWDYVITKSNNGKRIRKNKDKKLTPTPEPSPVVVDSASVSVKKNGK